MRISVVFVLAFVQFSYATDVDECESFPMEDIRERATLMPCKRPPCKLKKGTFQSVELKFKTKEAVPNVINRVQAEVLGVPLPFIGHDGLSVCNKIYEGDDPQKKATCPLKANTEYIYRDAFKVESFYPSVSIRILWSLKHKNKDLICFEVPARII